MKSFPQIAEDKRVAKRRSALFWDAWYPLCDTKPVFRVPSFILQDALDTAAEQLIQSDDDQPTAGEAIELAITLLPKRYR